MDRFPQGSSDSAAGLQARRLRPLEVVQSACLTGAGHTDVTLERFLAGESAAGVCPLDEITRDVPRRLLRRLKRLPRTVIALARRVAPAAGHPAAALRSVFVGTAFGALSETHDFLAELFATGEELSSPTDFIGSVHNSVAGQLAIHHGATGPNVTTTGEDDAFEQALLLAALSPLESDLPCLVVGADEAHPVLSPLVDANATGGVELADGAAALWLAGVGAGTGVRVTPLFLGSAPDQTRLLDALLAAVGGGSALDERFGAVFAGIPRSRRRAGAEELAALLERAGYAGPVVDYRRSIGETGSASAVATVLACRICESGVLPAALTAGGDVELGGRGILLLGFGTRASAVAVER